MEARYLSFEKCLKANLTTLDILFPVSLPEHENTQSVVIRTLKHFTHITLALPNYGDLLEEGEAFRRQRKIWAFAPDKIPLLLLD